MSSLRCALLGALFAVAGCSRLRPAGEAPPDAATAPVSVSAGDAAPAVAASAGTDAGPVDDARTNDAAPAPADRDTPTSAEPPRLIELTVPGDRPVYISHATAETERALVYLHGVCGDIFAVRSWLAAASRFGTLIVMLGDKPCGSGRYRWSSSTPELHARVQRALDAAKQARAGRLDSGAAMILGYSQGATRAEFLASQFPEQYPLVLLGGAPTQPSERRLARAKAVAIVGGEREPHDQMRFGARDLAKAGVRARFWLLPDAGHGQYGPDGSRVMGEALAFLVDAAP